MTIMLSLEKILYIVDFQLVMNQSMKLFGNLKMEERCLLVLLLKQSQKKMAYQLI